MNVVYFQSGGPTAVINSSLYGVIKVFQAHNEFDKLYCARYGITGLIDDNLIEIDKNKDYSFLKRLPGSYTGTARVKLSDDFSDERYSHILATVLKYKIDLVVVNGGNDSMDTGMKLSNFFKEKGVKIKVFGVPKTVDNDLANCDFAPGFGSALNYIVNATIDTRLDMDSYKSGRIVIMEAMGREAGWLAASSVVARDYGVGPDLIYVSEIPFDIDKFIADIKRINEQKKNCLVVVSEFLGDEEGNYICHEDRKDEFGHIQLGGSLSSYLASEVQRRLGINTRYLVLSTLQRSFTRTISPFDSDVASRCGEIAMESFLAGKENGAVSIKFENFEVKYHLVEFEKAANWVRRMPANFINEEKNNITDEGKKYFEFFYNK